MSEKEESESSPGTSPFQQVPAHDSLSRQTTYSNDTSIHSNNEYSPYLNILIQPQEQFRFRYKSEREGGTHGYLQGEYCTSDSTKTFPTVELRNYSGDAIIKCQLYQHDKNEEHPHTLYEENRGDRETKVMVSEKKGYTIYFQGLGIIHTAKRDVAAHLYDKLTQRMSENNLRNLDRAKLRERCKKIDLNRVRLRFSAHDVKTDKEICAVYSRTIKNMKSAETNELKICRSSRATGCSSGGQGVMLFVEKVNKGKIRVNFFEEDRGWEQEATIHEVHRQFGIYITTPRYKEISSDVKVWFELQRVSDGSRSEPRQFTYTPEPRHLLRKRPRQACARAAEPARAHAQPVINAPIIVPAEIVYRNFENPSPEDYTSNESFERADPNMEHEEAAKEDNLWEVLSSLDIPVEPYDSAINPDPPILPSDKPDAGHVSLPHINNAFTNMDDEDAWEYTDFLTKHRDPLLSQSRLSYPLGREDTCGLLWATGTDVRDTLPHLVSDKPQPAGDRKLSPDADDNDTELEDNLQIYTLIKEIYELKKTKLQEWYEEVTDKLERLFEIRLSNGDTILHMLLEKDEDRLRHFMKLTRSLHQRHMLDARDTHGLSVLHRAVLLRRNHLLTALVQTGCDPLCTDFDGNNVIHHAVKGDAATLAALLDAMAHDGGHDKQTMALKLAQCNDEGQTPLHLSVAEGCAAHTRLLLAAGAEPRQERDGAGWAPVHTAVRLDRPDLVQTLLESIPEQFREDVDVVIMRGQTPWYTALQLACAEDKPHAAEIANLLLEYGADPLVQSTQCPAAWRLARRAGGAVWAALAPRAPHPAPPSPPPPPSDDSDDYLSADDGDSETEDNDIAAKLGVIKIN